MKKQMLTSVIVGLLLVSVIGNIIQYYYAYNNRSLMKKNYVSYEEFISFFEQMDYRLSLTGYENIGNNEMTQIIYIDSDASFGRRNYLTLDNQQSDLQTQKRIEFVSLTYDEFVAIDFIYLAAPLYKDLIYWNDPLKNDENQFIKDVYTDNILSFKNILIKISVASTSKGNEESINKSLTQITNQVVDCIIQVENQQ